METKSDKTRKTYYTNENEKGNDYGINYKHQVYEYGSVDVPIIVNNNFNLNIE